MINYKLMHEGFKTKIISPKKNKENMMKVISLKTDYCELNLDFKGIYFKEMIIRNILNSDVYKTINMSEADLDIKVFKILENSKSEKYYENATHQFVYLIYESNTGYLESNSNRLFLELAVEQGVDHEDVAICSDIFKSYLVHISMLYS